VNAYSAALRKTGPMKERKLKQRVNAHRSGLWAFDTAKKNLERLSSLGEAVVSLAGDSDKIEPQYFIEEVGKAGVVNLYHLAPPQILVRMVAGDRVYLKIDGANLVVENAQGEYLGQVEPKHGQRLIKLIRGGNKYTAAIVNIDNITARVIIREVFQHPSQIGRPSFPVRAVEGFYPHVKDTLLRHGAVEEEALEEGEEVELEEGELIPEGFSIFEGVPPDDETMIEEEFMEG